MITVAEGERIDCIRNDGKFIGIITLINNRPGNCIAFKLKTNNTESIHVTPSIGTFTGQSFKIQVKCEKALNNAKLQVQALELGNEIVNKNEIKQFQQLFQTLGHQVELIKLEIVTLETQSQQKAIISSLPPIKKEELFYKSDFAYEQQIQKKKDNSVQQLLSLNQNNLDSAIQNSQNNSEQRYYPQYTFQQVKNTPSKQSSNSQNNIPQSDFPPKPQQYPHQLQQPQQIINQQEKLQDQDPYILRLNQRIQQLTEQQNQLLSEQKDLERQKLQLLNKDISINNKNETLFEIQHIFISALFFFLLGYLATN